MTPKLRLAALSALFTILGAPLALAAPPELDPGLVAADACMANALTESGFQGVIRIETPPDQDRSLADCDLEAETLRVADYRAVAGPCVAERLRDLGYLGGFRAPRGGRSRDDRVCASPRIAAPPPVAPSPSASAGDLATFRGADGRLVTVMRPIPNPD